MQDPFLALHRNTWVAHGSRERLRKGAWQPHHRGVFRLDLAAGRDQTAWPRSSDWRGGSSHFPAQGAQAAFPPHSPRRSHLTAGTGLGLYSWCPTELAGDARSHASLSKWGASIPPHVAGKGSPPQRGWGPALPRTAPLPSMSIGSEETANWIRGSETKPAGNRHFCSLPGAEALSLCWLMSPCWLPSGRHTGALYVQPETAVIQHKSILGRVWGKNEMLASLQKREIISLGMTEL